MNNELFSNLRFSGMDRIGDQKFYTLSLKYKKIQMGMEKVSLSISKKYFLDDRKVWIRSMNSMSMGMSMADSLMSMSMNQGSMGMSMDKGPIVMMGKWMPKKGTMIMAYGGYIKENKKVPLGGFTLNHNFDKGSFGVAKRYRRMSGDFNYLMDYSEVYANINLSSKFKFIAKLKKDNEIDKNIESVVGFEYENCCFAFRVTGSDKNLSRYSNKEIYYPYLDEAWDNIIEIENKGRVNFEFELKGFNSSSNKINRLLNNSLFNY
jgi:LPS-assembly protein